MFSSGKNIDSFRLLFLEFKRYIELQKEYAKLDLTEKLTIILSAIITIGIVMLLCSIVLLFATFALAYYIGNALGSLPLGFGIIATFVLLMLWFFYANRRRFVIKPMARFLSKLFIRERNENTSNG